MIGLKCTYLDYFYGYSPPIRHRIVPPNLSTLSGIFQRNSRRRRRDYRLGLIFFTLSWIRPRALECAALWNALRYGPIFPNPSLPCVRIRPSFPLPVAFTISNAIRCYAPPDAHACAPTPASTAGAKTVTARVFYCVYGPRVLN